MSGQSRNCPDNPEIFRTIQKLSGQSKNCPDNPEIVWIIRKLSGQSRNYPDKPETVQTIQKLSGQSKNCPDNPQTVRTIHKLSGQSTNCQNNQKILYYAHLSQICQCHDSSALSGKFLHESCCPESFSFFLTLPPLPPYGQADLALLQRQHHNC